ncbi:MAG: hypothetical protein AB9903_28140 [Vulcanimicrobiota bacterium]
MNAAERYLGSLLLMLILSAGFLAVCFRKRIRLTFTTMELTTGAFLICLMYVSVTPWSISLSKVPGIDALVFSIPYTAVLLIGLQLVPKAGMATLLIAGHGLLGQLTGRGLNPVWWPYYLMCGLAVEMIFLASGCAVRRLYIAILIATARGSIAYVYMYYVLAPFVWHKFYPDWYICAKAAFGIIGSVAGAYMAWKIAPTVEKLSKVYI